MLACAALPLFGACDKRDSKTHADSRSVESQAIKPKDEDVYPPVLRGKESLELGQLVLLLMPEKGSEPVGWDFRSDSPIAWQTVGYKEIPETGYTMRTGWVRVNIQGAKSTVFRERKTELGWTVELSSSSAKFGPKQITIKPGGEGKQSCFGASYDGCEFAEPFTSLVKAGINIETICAERGIGGHVSAFVLTHPQRRPTRMEWKKSEGSGGGSSWITLKLDTDQQARYDSNLCHQD